MNEQQPQSSPDTEPNPDESPELVSTPNFKQKLECRANQILPAVAIGAALFGLPFAVRQHRINNQEKNQPSLAYVPSNDYKVDNSEYRGTPPMARRINLSPYYPLAKKSSQNNVYYDEYPVVRAEQSSSDSVDDFEPSTDTKLPEKPPTTPPKPPITTPPEVESASDKDVEPIAPDSQPDTNFFTDVLPEVIQTNPSEQPVGPTEEPAPTETTPDIVAPIENISILEDGTEMTTYSFLDRQDIYTLNKKSDGTIHVSHDDGKGNKKTAIISLDGTILSEANSTYIPK